LADAKPASIQDLYFNRMSSDAVWSADGESIFISTNLTGRMNIWKVPVNGGFPIQMAQSDDAQTSLAVSADGHWLAYQSDQAGKEIFDVLLIPAAGGEPVNLTASEEWSETNPLFSPDSQWVAMSRRGKSAPSPDLVVVDVATGKLQQLTTEASPNRYWQAIAFSPDGGSLYANRGTVDQSGSAIYRISLATGKRTALTKDAHGVINTAMAVSADGHYIATTIQTAAGDQQAAMFDTRTGASTIVFPDPWEQRAIGFSPDGRSLLIASNTNGRDRILRYNIATRSTSELPMPVGMNSDEWGRLPLYSPKGDKILTLHESGNTPPDYWVINPQDGKARQVTRLGLASMRPEHLPATQIVNFASDDGTIISGVLWMPFNLPRDGRAPAVVMPHGGPTWQTKDRFDAMALALATRGYLVLAPNARGSTGYGRAFREGNHMDLGGGDLADQVAAAKFMVESGFVDAGKIGITGGSYGGYLTLMAMGRTPGIWAAGVAEYGIVNWYSMWQNGSPQLRFYQKSLIGDPVKDKATYDAASPMTYLRATRAPLLVLQGDNDLRVPKEQAVEVVNILKAAGKTVDAHYYPGEGHGFQKRENQIDALERAITWFDTYLKDKP
jgi:dipeptidyl aminopeptidase/acylaminoacyl peptidase